MACLHKDCKFLIDMNTFEFEEDIDEYTSEGIFFVSAGARWSEIAAKAHTPEIGTVIDDAMRKKEKDPRGSFSVMSG